MPKKPLRAFPRCLALLLLLCTAASCAPGMPQPTPEPPAVTDPAADSTSHVHTFGEWEVRTAPTCTQTGTVQHHCPCGVKGIRVTPATGHTPGEWTVSISPTCMQEGTQQTACTACGVVLDTQIIPKTGHTPGEWTVIESPSYTEDGLQQIACTVCGITLDARTLPRHQHTPSEWTTHQSPTCTKDGTQQIVCTDCGAVLDTQIIPQNGHTPGEWITVSLPTALESGEKQIVCSVCQQIILTESIPEFALQEADRVAAQLRDIQSEHTFTFAALSDVHMRANSDYSQSKNSVKSAQMAKKSLQYLEERIHLEGAVLLGDYTAAGQDYTVPSLIDDLLLAKEHLSDLGDYPVAWLRGNHEINYYPSRDRVTTDEELFEYVDKNSRGVIFDPDNPHGGYGYIDFPEAKIRMICLNTTDALAENPAVDGQEAPAAGISTAQLSWLANTALDFTGKDNPEEWGIVVASHHPLNITKQLESALQILEAYRNRTAGQVRYTVNGTKYSLSYDFINIIPAEILCNIHGHNHNFNDGQMGINEPWLWRFCIPNVTSGRENGSASSPGTPYADKWGDFDENGDPVYYKKYYWSEEIQDYVYDDENGTSYCLITIDRENRKIYAHYVGVGRDRIYDY